MTLQHKCVFLYILCKDLEIGWLGNRLNLFNIVLTYLPTSLCAILYSILCLPTASHFHILFPTLTILVGVYGPLSVAFICISMLTNNIQGLSTDDCQHPFFFLDRLTMNVETDLLSLPAPAQHHILNVAFRCSALSTLYWVLRILYN